MQTRMVPMRILFRKLFSTSPLFVMLRRARRAAPRRRTGL